MAVPIPNTGFTGTAALARARARKVFRGVLGWIDTHIGRHGAIRFTVLLAIYTLELATAFWLAYDLRWDFSVPQDFTVQRLQLLAAVVLCKVLLLHSFGQFRSMLSYFGLADFSGVVLAMSAASMMMLGLWVVAAPGASPPRGVILMDFVLSISLLSAFRLFLRVARTWAAAGAIRPGLAERRIAIVGAGDVGEALAKELLSRQGSGLRPVLFLDDDPAKIGRSIHGLPVHGPLEKLLEIASELQLHELVVAMPSAGPKVIREIVELGRRIGANTQIVPSAVQLASGQVRVDRTRPVAIEDLLGRDQVPLDGEGIDRLLRDQVVLVTGAGGSIGSELCRQVLEKEPRLLIMVEQTEIALFEIENELLATPAGRRILPLIADITDGHSMRAVFATHRPSIVFHAAAHKHVPLMERQPCEAIKNNTFGTAQLARLASEHQVERFVLISTDKAINPTSVMGCSKRLAEKALQARQRAAGNKTRFLAVRFGNVLGSSGSVIPTFRRQIAQGGPVTVTHREMTRYFMTIPEAVGLVLQTATLGTGGEIFILDMGKPVKILDMARQMIELSGFKPDIDIEVRITGLRPGEKLYEELRHTDETHETTTHPRVFRLKASPDAVAETDDGWITALRAVADSGDAAQIKAAMKRLVPEYTPYTD
ncbi:MAG TPA: nucleoside-diphosphate sugar epimerase/dehydratase [Opitutaceae bacterium]|nr:nucleoside-diphosphate sugar epimerase/dehydratase [Opitutaceae bacterium]